MRVFLTNFIFYHVPRPHVFIAYYVYDYTRVQHCCLYKKKNKSATLLLMPVLAHSKYTVKVRDPIFSISLFLHTPIPKKKLH